MVNPVFHELTPGERKSEELRHLYQQQAILWQFGMAASFAMMHPAAKINPACYDGSWERALEKNRRRIEALLNE